MKICSLFALLQLMIVFGVIAQQDMLPARVYHIAALPVVKDSSRLRIQLMDGKTVLLSNIESHITLLQPGQAAHPPHTHSNTEELIIVKEGQVTVTIKGKSKTLSPGGLALSLPGDEHGTVNTGKTPASYYVIKYSSPVVNRQRGDTAGGSILMDWPEAAVEKTEKGERRQFFNRATTLFGKFDMHVTTLNQGEVSHLPHTHRQEEIIIIKQGSVTMQIADKFYPATAGDVIFLSSGIPHALNNTGNGQTVYFAFQWL